MKRTEFYITAFVISILLAWSVYVLNYSSKVELNETIDKLDSLKVKVEILQEISKRDTIIINLNLNQKQNGN